MIQNVVGALRIEGLVELAYHAIHIAVGTRDLVCTGRNTVAALHKYPSIADNNIINAFACIVNILCMIMIPQKLT